MAIGRISGPLLASNLQRDGRDLAFETDLLYLDVTNGRIGVKTSAPQTELDINGALRSNTLTATTATLAKIFISGNVIGTTTGPISLTPSGNNSVYFGTTAIALSQLQATQGVESSNPATGSLVVTGGAGVSGNVNVGGKGSYNAQVQAYSPETGTLVVDGGAGITQDLWVGGFIHGRLTTSTYATNSVNADNILMNEITNLPVADHYIVLSEGLSGFQPLRARAKFKYDINNDRLVLSKLIVSGSENAVSTNTGALQVFGGVGINKDLYVGGDIHAVGNITAEGNIQLGNSTGTDTLLVEAGIATDLVPKESGTYSIGTATNTWAAGFFDELYTKILASQTGPININPASGLLEINAEIKVNGRKPIGTAPVTTNVLYVSADGNDTNDGRAQDSSRACRTIGGALRSPYYLPGTSIKVAPGIYRENNPLVLQPYTSIIGSDLRTTSIEPINKTQDLFHLQSGCYLAQMQFLNGRSGLLPGQYANGYNRGAYATAFPPQVGGTKIDVFHSPYVQNCTNQNGPWLNDGTLFVPNQTVQIPQAVGTGTWSANTTTIVVTVSTGTITTGMKINPGHQNPGFFNARTLLLANKPFMQEQIVAYVNQNFPTFVYQQAKCFRDVGIILENVAYDTAFGGNEKSVEAGLSYYDGVTSVIAGQETQTVAAINYIDALAQYIINNQTAPDLIGASAKYKQVINTVLIGGNIAGDSITNHLGIITNIINNGPSVAPTMYKSSGPDYSFVSAEILLQANRSFIQNDVMAWISNTYPNFVYNQDKCYRDVGLIVDAVSQDIVLGGNCKTVEAALSYWTGGYNQITGQETTTTQAIAHARDISVQIIANQAVTKQTGFVYSTSTCYRDTGLIVDSLAFDILYQGTSQSAFAGLQYWNQAGYTGDILRELTTTTNAITYLKGLVSSVAQDYGNTTQRDVVNTNFTTILTILNSGTAGVTDIIEPNGVASSDSNTISAYNAILTNKTSFQSQVITYINDNNPGFSYNTGTCYRDVGYMVDSVAFDLLHGGNRQSVMSGVYYYGYDATSSAVSTEKPQVTGAYTHIKTIVEDIVQGKLITPYQTAVSQKTSINVATSAEVTTLSNCTDLIVSIINNGPDVAPPQVPIGLTASTDPHVGDAFNLLIQNRSFIQAEVLAYIDATYGNNIDQVINTFFSGGDAATAAVMRNFDIINTVIPKGEVFAPPIYEGGGLFSLTGINGDDIKLAPVVTDVVTLSPTTYKITLDNPTIGFGINSTLFFGETAVFPKLDIDVPDRWAQRRVDTRGGMGGSLVDGGVVSARSPIASFVYDAFTQVAQGGRGIHIINNGYAQLVSVFTIFCSIAVEVDAGGIASITNSNSNFGDLCLVAKGYGKRDFSGTIYNPAYPSYIDNGEYYPNGYFPQRGKTLIFVPDTANRPHIALIMEVEPPSAYVNAYGYPGFVTAAPNTGIVTTGSIIISGIDTTDINIGQTLHIRDQYGRTYDDNGVPYLSTGTIISDIGYQYITLNKETTSGGGDSTNPNYFTLYTCGNAYYTVLSSSIYDNPVPVGQSLIETTSSQTTAELGALNFVSTLTQKVISNISVVAISTLTQTILPTVSGGSGSASFVGNEFNIITGIVQNGVNSAPTATKLGTPPPGAGSAIELIKANIEFITQETVTYVKQQNPSLGFSTTKCARDVRLILQQIIYDLETGGNYYAVYSGLSYFSRQGTYHLVELGENLNNPELMPDGATVNFYQRSYISASGYLFEYVGAGTNYGSLPQVGRADPIQTKETVQLDSGKVFFTSTDQNGDFRIGPGLVISQATGVLSGRTFTKSLFAEMTPFILAVEGAG
jgi:hypothetical protein